MKKIQSCFAKNVARNLRLSILRPTAFVCNEAKMFHSNNDLVSGLNVSKTFYKDSSSFSFSTKLPRHKVVSLPNLSPSMETVTI